MRRLLLLLSALFVLALPAHAQSNFGDWRQIPPLRTTPPTDRTNALVQRLLELDPASSDFRSVVMRTAKIAGRLVGEPFATDYAAAMAQVIDGDPTVLEQLRAVALEVTARSYTDEELAAMVAYAEHPLGKSIRAKSLSAPPLTMPVLTPEEQAFRTGFYSKPPGAGLEEKMLKVRMLTLVAVMPVFEQIKARTDAIYCKGRPNCPPAPKSAPSASAPSTAPR